MEILAKNLCPQGVKGFKSSTDRTFKNYSYVGPLGDGDQDETGGAIQFGFGCEFVIILKVVTFCALTRRDCRRYSFKLKQANQQNKNERN